MGREDNRGVFCWEGRMCALIHKDFQIPGGGNAQAPLMWHVSAYDSPADAGRRRVSLLSVAV